MRFHLSLGRKAGALCAVLASVLVLGSMAQAAITIDTVHVGNVGNTADTRYASPGYGAVGYSYNIGKYEVTAGQYTAFLNAVAATDTNALYNANMSKTAAGSGITQSGSSGSYTYSVDPAFVNRPVNYVTFWDATRFANWLSNGQPTGAQGPGTTETGTYTLTPTGIANNTITRNAGATWAVTSEDEWYKAAYYGPTLNGGAGGYYDYATSSNSVPGRDLNDTSGNNANYYDGSGAFPIDSPYYTTVVDQFQNSASPYGTFDQGGNVWEWNEAMILGSYRGIRGGAYFDNNNFLLASFRNSVYPTGEDSSLGFRVSEVPEPGTIALLAFTGIGMLLRRRGVCG